MVMIGATEEVFLENLKEFLKDEIAELVGIKEVLIDLKVSLENEKEKFEELHFENLQLILDSLVLINRKRIFKIRMWSKTLEDWR